MAYLGRDVTYGVHHKQLLTDVTNGVDQNFDLAFPSVPAEGMMVVYSGVIQEPGVAYTVTNTQIQFDEAPEQGEDLYIIYLGRQITSLQTTLNIAGSAQGTILYYDGSDWVVLTAGTAGELLITGGIGANPSWGDPGHATVDDLAAMAIALGG